MTARTAVTPIVLTRDTAGVLGAGTAVASTMTIASGFKTQVQILNGAGSSFNVTVRARGNGVDATGAAQTTGYQPMAQASIGDLVFAVANGATAILSPVTLDRFQQADGSISIEFSATTSSKIWAIKLP